MSHRPGRFSWLAFALLLAACDVETASSDDPTLRLGAALAPFESSEWPGGAEVQHADVAGVLGANLRGLHFDPFGPFGTDVVWAVRSSPGALLKLIWDGAALNPDAASGFRPDKPLRYPDGTGNPSAQGVTWDDEDSYPFLVVANRDNDDPLVHRSSVLNYPPWSAASELVAGTEWNLTADIPALPPDGGAKAIQWAPWFNLAFNGFYDESKGRVFDRTDYPDNATNGVIFVGLDNGLIHAYVLHYAGAAYTRIATIDSGLRHVTALDFITDDQLWATCDNRCNGSHVILELDATGRFVPAQRFDRPAGMPNLDNEGFAFSRSCGPVFWSDIRNTHDHAIRVGTRCPPGEAGLPTSLLGW